MPQPFRVLAVDDHPVVLFGLRMILKDHPNFVLVAEASSPARARDLVNEHRPDFAVCDFVMGVRDGTNLIQDLIAIHPPVQILVYSSYDNSTYVRAALAVGARGYLSKTEGLDQVVEALGRIAAGEAVFGRPAPPGLVAPLDDPNTRDAGLSRRELQVLERIGRAESLKVMAQHLGLSVKTVGTYRERLKIKLGFDTLRALERYAEDVLIGKRKP